MSKDTTSPMHDGETEPVAPVTDISAGHAHTPAAAVPDLVSVPEPAVEEAEAGGPDVVESRDSEPNAAESDTPELQASESDAPVLHAAAEPQTGGADEAVHADDVVLDESADDDAAAEASAHAAQAFVELETPVLADVLVAVEELWPESLAESWDRVGLVVGRTEAAVERIMFAVDPTLEVIDEALEWGAQLLVTHHPLLLKGVNSVAATSGKGKAVHRLIEGGCALLTVHTNGDSAVGGVSDVLADAIGLGNVEPLVRAPLGLVEEGIGRVGMLAGPEKLGDLAARVFLQLPAVAGGVRVAGDKDALVRKVAVCGGAGDSLFDAVCATDADVFVTADLRHHPASEAREARADGKPYLIDLSHFASEWLWLPAAAQALGNVLADQGFAAELVISQTNTDPWDFILTPGN